MIGTANPISNNNPIAAKEWDLEIALTPGPSLVRAGRIRGRSRRLPAGGYFLETIGVFGDRPHGPGRLLRSGIWLCFATR